MQGTKKEEKKRRIIGRMIMSIRKDLKIQKKGEREEKKVIMVGRIKYGKGSLRIVGDSIRKWGYGEEIRRVEGMDGEIGGGSKNDNWKGLQRKDRVRGRMKKKGKRGKGIRRIARNKEGRMLVKGIRERGWMITNCRIKGDEKTGWTYMGGEGESWS